MTDILLEQIEYDILVENVYTKVKATLNDGKFGVSDIIEIVPLLINASEKLKDINGLDKKTICIMVLRRIISRTIKNDDEKNELLNFVNDNASKMIDVVVFAANGKMLLAQASKLPKRFFSWVKCCC